MLRRLLPRLLVLVPLAIACAVFVPTAAPLSAADPSLTLIAPAPGEVILDNEVKVIVAFPEGFTPADYHVHLWLDARPAHDSSLGVSLTDTTEHTFTNVFSGLHTLYAEMYRNDHVSMGQQVAAQVEFETAHEELKPVPKNEGQIEAPPEDAGGLFLPRGKGNTAITALLIILAVAILWFVFGHGSKR